MESPTYLTQSSLDSLAPNHRNQPPTPRKSPILRTPALARGAGANKSADRTTPIRHGPHVCHNTNPTILRSPIPTLLQPPSRSIPPNQSTLIAPQLRKPNNPHPCRDFRKNSSHVQQCITPSTHHARRDLQSIEFERLPVPPQIYSFIDKFGMARMDILPGSLI